MNNINTDIINTLQDELNTSYNRLKELFSGVISSNLMQNFSSVITQGSSGEIVFDNLSSYELVNNSFITDDRKDKNTIALFLYLCKRFISINSSTKVIRNTNVINNFIGESITGNNTIIPLLLNFASRKKDPELNLLLIKYISTYVSNKRNNRQISDTSTRQKIKDLMVFLNNKGSSYFDPINFTSNTINSTAKSAYSVNGTKTWSTSGTGVNSTRSQIFNRCKLETNISLTVQANSGDSLALVTNEFFLELDHNTTNPIMTTIYTVLNDFDGQLFNTNFDNATSSAKVKITSLVYMLITMFGFVDKGFVSFFTKNNSPNIGSAGGGTVSINSLHNVLVFIQQNPPPNNTEEEIYPLHQNYINNITNLKKDIRDLNTAIYFLFRVYDDIKQNFFDLYNMVNSYNSQLGTIKQNLGIESNVIIPNKYLFNFNQIHLNKYFIDTIEKKFDNITTRIKILDDDFVSPKFKDLIISSLSKPVFSNNNLKKIISVGLPINFIKSIYNNVQVNSTILRKEVKLIKIKIYRQDLKNTKFVFDPQEFYFDLNLFIDPVIFTNTEYIQGLIDSNNTVDSLKLHSYDLSTKTPINNKGAYLLTTNNTETKEITEIKTNIVENLYRSFILNQYTSILNSIELEEDDFPIINLTNENLVLNENTIFEFGNQNFNSTISNLKSLSPVQLRQQFASKINNIDLPLRNNSNKSRIFEKMLAPKKFDRIYNIIFDINEFKLNVDDTLNNFPVNEQASIQTKINQINNNTVKKKDMNNFENENIIDGLKTYTDNKINFDRYSISIELINIT